MPVRNCYIGIGVCPLSMYIERPTLVPIAWLTWRIKALSICRCCCNLQVIWLHICKKTFLVLVGPVPLFFGFVFFDLLQTALLQLPSFGRSYDDIVYLSRVV
nr:hypothetical protein [Solanum melongena]WMB97161.1 hypothetical protein [Solanum aethiopicum]